MVARTAGGNAANARSAQSAEDPRFADAHYNLARLYEHLGREVAAVRHLKAYRKLMRR